MTLLVDNTETYPLGVSAVLRTRENPIAFEELHDVFYDYENYLNPYWTNSYFLINTCPTRILLLFGGS